MSAPDRTREGWPAGLMTALIARHAGARPHAPAVTDGAGTLDWAAFAARIEGTAAQFAGLGLGEGGRLALWLPNGRDYLCAIFAAARLGATVLHINTRFGPAEVGDLLARAKARLLVTRAGFAAVDFLGVLGQVDPRQVAGLDAILCVGSGGPTEVSGVPVAPLAPAGTTPDRARPDAPCLVFTTGGTTSRPKLVLHTQASIAEHAACVARGLGMDRPGAALLGAIPFCGTFGNVAAMAMLAGGGHVVCQESFDAAAADGLIRAHAISHMVGDDRMLERLADTALAGAGAHTTMRFYGVGAFSTQIEAAWARGIAAGLQPRAIYGSSEVQALFAVAPGLGRSDDAVVPLDDRAAFRIVPHQSDAGSPEGEGALVIASPTLFAGYLDDDAATLAAKGTDGFATGDLAAPGTANGRCGFVFKGRLGDVVRLGGFLVHPLEIEDFLQAHPAVAEAQVVAVDREGRTAAVAFVVARPGAALDEAALLAHCRDRLARFKVPTRIVAVSAFPTSTGANGPKISRAALRTTAADLLKSEEAPRD